LSSQAHDAAMGNMRRRKPLVRPVWKEIYQPTFAFQMRGSKQQHLRNA